MVLRPRSTSLRWLFAAALALGCAEGQSDGVDVKGGADAAPDKEGDPEGDASDDATKDDVADGAAAEDVADDRAPQADTPTTPDSEIPVDASVTPDVAPDRVVVMDAPPDIAPPPPDLPPPPPDLPPPPDVAPPPPDVPTGLVCSNGLIRQSCRASENCCVTVGPIIGCGCAVPILGCILRGLPGCS